MKSSLKMLFLATVITGCSNYTQPHVVYNPTTPAERNFQAVWQASIDVLGEYRFEIDRKDRRAGIITTQRMLAKHWFEFWRSDAVSKEDSMEGTLQTVYRRATVRIMPVKGVPDRYSVRVEVEVSRPTSQGLEVIAAGEAYSRFLDIEEDDEYSRRERRKRRQREPQLKIHRGDDVAEEAADKPDGKDMTSLGLQDNLAKKLAAEIRALVAERLAGRG